MSDNYHQAVMGGTGANHVMIGTGDAIWFSEADGNPAEPPHNQLVAAGSPNAGVVDEIENPNPQPGTNNWYTEDGYGGGSYGSAVLRWRSYTQLLRLQPPGVVPVVSYLQSLARPIRSQLRARPLLSAEQLQSRLLRRRQQRLCRHQQSQRDRLHHPAVHAPQHRRRTERTARSRGRTTATSGTPTWPIRTGNYVTRRQHLLQHLQLLPVLDLDHDQPVGPHAHPGHDRPVRRHQERHPAGRFLCEARRMARWPSGFFEARPVRRLREEDRRRRPGESRNCGTAPPSS